MVRSVSRSKFQPLVSVLVSIAIAAGAMVGIAIGAIAAAAPAAAAPTDPTNYKVTLVARYCNDTSGATTTWPNVRANRARNNIQETLKNLGPNTNYANNMVPPVNPDKEEEAIAGQAACNPLVGMPITFGSNISGKAPLPAAPSPYLSKVGGSDPNVNATNNTTASVPRLDEQGNPVGSQTIAGAVTVTLNQAQFAQAGKNALWTMGGTTGNALPANDTFASGSYNFAALRCNTDALNGDNVEFIGFRNGQTHAFCYAWYIGDPGPPPPVPGVITIKKSASEAGGQAFGFQGNVSFNPGGTFSMRDSVAYPGDVFSETRAPGNWSVTETTLPTGWGLTGLTCVDGSGSTSTPNVGTRTVDIELGAGSTVVCTFTNALTPPPTQDLQLAKVTFGGTGDFPFHVTKDGGGFDQSTTLTTTNSQGEDPATDVLTGLTSGTYTMEETLPTTTSAGFWTATSVACVDNTGADVPTTGSGTSRQITIDTSGTTDEVLCTWANTFTPTSSLIIRAKTIGGSNAAINYLTTVVDPTTGECDPTQGLYDQNADTTGGAGFHTATGDSMINQPIQTYCIGGTRPTEGSDPSWVTKSIDCGPTNAIDENAPFGTSTEFTFAQVQVKPGETVTCDFTYVKRAALTLTKTVSGGNDLRSGPVEIELTCDASALSVPGDWPKTLSLPTGQSSGSLEPFYVDGDANGDDTCHATETANGAGGAQDQATIQPFWNGAAWPSGVKELQFPNTASLAGTTASNGQPVTTTLASGPCALSGDTLIPNGGSGTCSLSYSATGNPGTVTTTTSWALTGPSSEGDGDATGDFAVSAANDRSVGFTDAYTQEATTITTSRSVTLTKGEQTVDCKKASGQLKCDETKQGQNIKWTATCRPIGKQSRGDISWCRITKSNGKVTVKPIGGRAIKVKLTGKAKGTKNYKAWTRSWTWRLRG